MVQQSEQPTYGQPEDEQLVYALPQVKKRALLPKIVSLLTLGIIFYLGIMLNVALLNLTAGEQTIVKTASLIILLLVVIFGAYLAVHRAYLQYRFYRDKITFNKKSIYYTKIINTAPKQDFLDKLFKTYSVNLGNNFHIRNISQEIGLEDYLQKLIAYAKRRG